MPRILRPMILGMVLAALIASFFLKREAYIAQTADDATLYAACAAVDAEPCIIPSPFQPPAAAVNAIGTIYHKKERETQGLAQFADAHQKTLLVDGVPFSQYWQLANPDSYVFHPMAFGRYVFRHASDPSFRKTLPELLHRVSVKLPNGGAAIYYPKHYPLNRMRGPGYVYSAISQSSILAGFVRNDQLERTAQSRRMVEQIKKAMFFDHTLGGIELAGVAQLELPLFNSNPEIVLNGWLFSLLQLNDYAQLYHDRATAEYVRKNLRFFADHHAVWYDHARNISRYSDTSPHKVILQYRGKALPTDLAVIYKSKVPELPNYAIAPVNDPKSARSNFTVRVTDTDTNAKRLNMELTCSGLFDTYVVSRADFTLELRDGGYQRRGGIPTGGGKWHRLTSIPNTGDGLSIVPVTLDKGELICGYPTNFATKNNTNFYHMYHIIALLALADNPSFADTKLTQQLAAIAREWYVNTAHMPMAGVEDVDSPHYVLKAVNGAKTIPLHKNAAELFRSHGIALLPEHRVQ